TMTPRHTAPAPIQNGACGLTLSPSRPASHGATAPPEKRTKLYAAEATPRCTGAALMTDSVTSVLVMPSARPATTTQVDRIGLLSVNRAMRAGITAKPASAARRLGRVPQAA